AGLMHDHFVLVPDAGLNLKVCLTPVVRTRRILRGESRLHRESVGARRVRLHNDPAACARTRVHVELENLLTTRVRLEGRIEFDPVRDVPAAPRAVRHAASGPGVGLESSRSGAIAATRLEAD